MLIIVVIIHEVNQNYTLGIGRHKTDRETDKRTSIIQAINF